MTTNNILQKYHEKAKVAHYWTSFFPDKRATALISEFSAELTADLASIPEGEREYYQRKYESYFLAWLSAKGSCASPMICGPAKFNYRKAERANNREITRLQNFCSWRERALKAIRKKQDKTIPQSEKDQETIIEIKADIDRIKKVKVENLPYNVGLLVSNLAGRLETIAKAGRVEVLDEVIPYALAQGVITARHKINNLPQLAKSYQEKQEKGNIAQEFDGGRLVINYELERVQILFNDVPDEETRTLLKSRGFRWSPKNKAWQRKNTANGISAGDKIVVAINNKYERKNGK